MTTFAQTACRDFEAAGWPFVPTLSHEHVWDTFVILALLRDHKTSNLLLTVPHTGDQNDRFRAAMQERNERIVYLGQPEISHYCDGCMRVYVQANDGALQTFASGNVGPTILRMLSPYFHSFSTNLYSARQMPGRC